MWVKVRKREMDYVSKGPHKVASTRIDVCVCGLFCVGSDRGGVASMTFLNELMISLVETLDGLTTC